MHHNKYNYSLKKFNTKKGGKWKLLLHSSGFREPPPPTPVEFALLLHYTAQLENYPLLLKLLQIFVSQSYREQCYLVLELMVLLELVVTQCLQPLNLSKPSTAI